MKNSVKLKYLGFSLLIIGVILIVLGGIVFRDKTWSHLGWKPNFALFVPGMFISILSLPFIASGYSPQIAKFSAKLSSETIDYAKDEIQESVSKTADTIVPSITPSIKKAYSELIDKNEMSKRDQLKEAKNLLDDKLISEQEYQEMRKNILEIDD